MGKQSRRPVRTDATKLSEHNDLRANEVTQGTLHLNPFDADVPALTTPDGVEYIPLRSLCELLGLEPATWIGTVCARYRGDDVEGTAVRQLPYQRQDGQTSLEWCLDRYHVLRWFSFHLDGRHVPPGVRRQQLRTLQEQLMDVAGAVYQRRQDDYHDVKRDVIRRLRACDSTLRTLDEFDTTFGPHIEHTAPTSEEGRANRAEFVTFVAHGRALQEQLAAALRSVLQQMTDEPVIDALEVDEEAGEVVDTVAMPILPYVPDLSEVNRLADAAQRWLTEDFVAWMRAHGFAMTFRPPNAPQAGE